MKRRTIFLTALVAVLGVMAFGATDAFASYFKFNHSTGQMTYTESGFPGTSPANDVRVHVDPTVNGFYFIDDVNNVVEQEPAGDLGKYCYVHDYHGWQLGKAIIWFHEWSCPASSILIQTEAGDDTITVDDAVKIPTTLEGGAGIDWIYGGGGPDLIQGGCTQSDPNYPCSSYLDVVLGGAGKDEIHGGNGGDILHGGLDNDTLDGGAGQDSVYGDGGDDLVGGGPGADKIFGSDGTDIADYSNASSFVTASLDGNANDGGSEDNTKDTIEPDVEGIQGGTQGDTLVGNDLPNVLRGGDGSDVISGAGGDDILSGQGGGDTIRPGLGLDNVYGGSDANAYHPDTVTYDERTNPVNVSLDNLANDGEAGESDMIASDVENVIGGSGKDTLSGNGHGNMLDGGNDNDTLVGNGGGPVGQPGLGSVPDVLHGGYGQDVLDGGPAGTGVRDTIDGGQGTDLVTYGSRTDGVTIYLDGPQNEGEDDITGVENVKAGSGDDLIVGNDGQNTLLGYDGNDTIDGNGGPDVLGGGIGNDSLFGGEGHDVLSAGEGADTMNGGYGDDLISGHEGIDTVTYADSGAPVTVSLDNAYNDGSAGEGDNVLDDTEIVIGSAFADTITGSLSDNKLVGLTGMDTLNGDGGADTIDGGTQNDTLLGGDGTDTLEGGLGDDNIDGGGGSADVADYRNAPSAVSVYLNSSSSSGGAGNDTLANVENLYGSSFDDNLGGDAAPNLISGFDGADYIYGAPGNDHIFGAGGNDLLRGGLDDDEINGGLGSDTVDYALSPGAETVNLSSYNGSAAGGLGNDWLAMIENVTGSSYADSITGSPEANIILGGAGNDTLQGLGGDDTLDGQADVDSVDGGMNVDSCLGEARVNCEK